MSSQHTATRLRAVVALAGIVFLISIVLAPLMLGARRQPSASELVQAFRFAELDLSPTQHMGTEDWGRAPRLASEALVFDIWTHKDCICSLDPKGLVMSFDSQEDLDATRDHYLSLVDESTLYGKWVITAGNVMLVVPATLPEEQIAPYAQVMSELTGQPHVIAQ